LDYAIPHAIIAAHLICSRVLSPLIVIVVEMHRIWSPCAQQVRIYSSV
jgi:hypothetical protein